MAREEVPITELAAIRDDLMQIARRVAEAIEIAEAGALELPLVHGAATANTYVPYMRDWSIKLRSDLEAQAESAKRGRKSLAAVSKQRYEARRKKAAQE